MLRSDQGTGRRALLLAVLVISLLTGLVAMHHLSTGGSGPPRTVEAIDAAEPEHAPAAGAAGQRDDMPGAPAPADHGDNGLLHLCMAILTGVAIVLAALLEWRRSVIPTARPALRVIRPVPAPRGPPPSTPARLALLCVLRT